MDMRKEVLDDLKLRHGQVHGFILSQFRPPFAEYTSGSMRGLTS